MSLEWQESRCLSCHPCLRDCYSSRLALGAGALAQVCRGGTRLLSIRHSATPYVCFKETDMKGKNTIIIYFFLDFFFPLWISIYHLIFSCFGEVCLCCYYISISYRHGNTITHVSYVQLLLKSVKENMQLYWLIITQLSLLVLIHFFLCWFDLLYGVSRTGSQSSAAGSNLLLRFFRECLISVIVHLNSRIFNFIFWSLLKCLKIFILYLKGREKGWDK